MGRKPRVSRDTILRAALTMLADEGLSAVTMRALARSLRVDAMSLYHHVGDRDSLLTAAAALAYQELELPPPRPRWDDTLFAIAVCYGEFLGRTGDLVRYLATSETASALPGSIIGAHVHGALAKLGLSRAASRTAHDAFIDFVHGFALSIPRSGLTPTLRSRLRAELTIMCKGIEPR